MMDTDSTNQPPPPPDSDPTAEVAAVSQSPASTTTGDRVLTAPPTESSTKSTLEQTTSTPEAVKAGGSGIPPAEETFAPPQRRRTSSFEYTDDGTSQYDNLKLVPTGPTPLSPLFLDLIRAKIREAERQLHFAILATKSRDRLDASKRCSCAMAEIDYVRQKVYLPPPIQLLDVRVLRASALASMYGNEGEDKILGVKKTEAFIQRAFQVLGELVDWGEVKRRGAAVEMLEEFLPMCYFEDGKTGPTLDMVYGTGEGDEGHLDYVEVMALWYQIMIDHGRITQRKAEWKEGEMFKKIKVENYAKAIKLFAVGMEGLSEIYEDQTDKEYLEYTKIATDAMEKIACNMTENSKQDELLEIVESTTPKLDLTPLKIMITRAKLRIQDRKEELKRKQEAYQKAHPGRLSDATKETEEEDDDDDDNTPKDKGKGKAKEDPEDSEPVIFQPKVDKGKGKAAILPPPPDIGDDGPPSYFDSETNKSSEKEEKEDGDDWVLVQDPSPTNAEFKS
ncbi:hypothetical protein ABW19_dt0203339 [Dactylella cylindrospora]|nr:hypothetical protein ABW19_dt0203339 [Dactylella cylindrospora]